MTRGEKIAAIAKSYIGQQEIQPNAGFKDPAFLAKMVARGWEKGQPWCGYFGKQCWVEGYADNPQFQLKIKQLLNGGAQSTLENCKASGLFVINMIPAPGALIIFLEGKGPEGHEAVGTSAAMNNIFQTVEGNTNTDGSRDGYEVAAKTHELGRPYNPKGLNIVAIIHPVEI